MELADEKMSDEEIARQVQKGDFNVFGFLVERYKPKITRYGKKFLAGYSDIEDITQEVFLRAFENIQSFDSKRKFSPWIYRIAHNQFVNAIKKQKREPLPFFDADTIFPHPLSKDLTEQKAKQGELKQVVVKCLNNLQPKYREILVLYYFEEFSYKEISEILKIPLNTVGVRIKRGREKLKNLCKKLNYE